MKRTMAIVAVLATAGGGLWLAQAQDNKPTNPKAELMRKKLANAQVMLEGLALGDFRKLERSAEELSMISKKAEWRVIETPEYTRYSEEFRRNCADVEAAAKKKNIDGATIGYLKLTTTCVECHKHVRETKIAMK